MPAKRAASRYAENDPDPACCRFAIDTWSRPSARTAQRQLPPLPPARDRPFESAAASREIWIAHLAAEEDVRSLQAGYIQCAGCLWNARSSRNLNPGTTWLYNPCCLPPAAAIRKCIGDLWKILLAGPQDDHEPNSQATDRRHSRSKSYEPTPQRHFRPCLNCPWRGSTMVSVNF